MFAGEPELQIDEVYEVELCSGERRRWRYLGPDSRALVWWRDLETGRDFAEGNLMYAWHIVSRGKESAYGPSDRGVAG